MGKTSSTAAVAYPAFSKGSVSLNGQNKASVSKIGNEITSNYNMNDYEKSMYDYAQKSLADFLPKINVFDKATKNSLKSEVEAYKSKAVKNLEDIYAPMLDSLKNDIASRFGNFDNSMFMNNLGTLEKYRSSALGQIAQDIQSYQSDLYNKELANRYSYLNTMNNLINGTNNNALNYISSAYTNSNAGNAYNLSNYNNLANAMKSSNYGISDITNGIGDVANIALMMGIL